jgi:hypothetical protein
MISLALVEAKMVARECLNRENWCDNLCNMFRNEVEMSAKSLI